jgi:hypothetical protein
VNKDYKYGFNDFRIREAFDCGSIKINQRIRLASKMEPGLSQAELLR